MKGAPSRALRLTIAVMLAIATMMTAGVLSGSASKGLLSASPALASGTYSVSVSYADSTRGGVTYPVPFVDDAATNPNIVVEACSPEASCQYDGGAIKIDNNSGAPATISVSVTIGTCVYDTSTNANMWPSANVPNNGSLILAQIISGASSGCQHDGTFDTSDVPSAGNCFPSGDIPAVSVTFNGVTTTYNDTAQVLNTGGIDTASCNGVNESHAWTPIGSANVNNCNANVLTLAPATQTHATGQTATLTANLSDSCGNPVQNATVSFADQTSGGADPNQSGNGVTDSHGNATFAYSSPLTGTDTWQASLSSTSVSSNSVSVNWVAPCSANAAGLKPSFGSPFLTNGGNTANIPQTDANGYYLNTYTTQNITAPPPQYNTATPGQTSTFTNVFNKAVAGNKATIKIVATDDQGCSNTFDPLFTSAIRSAGVPQSDSYDGIDQSESHVLVTNSNPGVDNLTLTVNGQTFRLTGLRGGENRSLSIASALQAGNNTITVTTTGRPGGSALVLVSG